ncbi:hypothetical protein, partial [Phenylobacterium sp.]|uniref:hypothetical protein n=1 Tax=Phenylobacterium sp. TaxID=1871053 RepID=UPI002737484E
NADCPVTLDAPCFMIPSTQPDRPNNSQPVVATRRTWFVLGSQDVLFGTTEGVRPVLTHAMMKAAAAR